MKPPYILIGMHRSGTSLLANVLHRSGIFMGVMQDHNAEALHFIHCNERLLNEAGGSWLHPREAKPDAQLPFDNETLYHEHFKARGKFSQLKLKLSPPQWGWKDPRNTFTLPFWLGRFPKAKVIYLHRASAPIVQSLLKRNGQVGEAYAEDLKEKKFAEELCAQYQNQAENLAKTLGERAISLSYEKLCALDKAEIERLEKFTGKRVYRQLKSLLR